jgi:hypothetical protein
MSDVANLLKQEREKNPKEPRLFVRRPPYPTELLKQPYPRNILFQLSHALMAEKGALLYTLVSS